MAKFPPTFHSVTLDELVVELVTLPAERYDELLATERRMTALERHGVDNWEWYGDAMEEL